MNFDQFKTEWQNRVVDYDHVYGYQCVDLILQYLYECYAIPNGVWGNAIDYWNAPTGALLSKFNKVGGSNAIQGDIVVFNGLPGNPYGHIGIATGNINAAQVEVLEQNGATGSGDGQGGNVIRTRYIDRSRVAGLLQPVIAATVNTAVAAAPSPTYDTVTLPESVATWAAYRVGSQLRKGTTDQVGSLLPSKFPGGITYPIVQWVGNYAVIVDTETYGRIVIWVKDTSAVFSNTPAPTPVPVVVKTAPPAAPLKPNGNPDRTIVIVKSIPGYLTATYAANHNNPGAAVAAGTYFIYNDYPNNSKLLNVTSTVGKAGSWINTDDNVPDAPAPPEPTTEEKLAAIRASNSETAPPPLPAAGSAIASTDPNTQWKSSYTSFKDSKGNPVNELYVFMRAWDTQDIEGKSNHTVNFGIYDELEMSGYFYRADSAGKQIKYYRPANATEVNRFFGVPQTDQHGQAIVVPEWVAYNADTTTAERQSMDVITNHDRVIIGLGKAKATVMKLESILDSYAPRVMDIVKGKKKR